MKRLSNYRLISNFPLLGKMTEKVVSIQLNNYLNANTLNKTFQSGFRAHHSTETALSKVLNDLQVIWDSGNLAILGLLDLSAAFDTVDHAIQLDRTGSVYQVLSYTGSDPI